MLQPLILLLTVLVISSAKCPSMCTCKHFLYTSVKCHGSAFQFSNVTLMNSTRFLEIFGLIDSSAEGLVDTLVESDLPELESFTLVQSQVGNVSVLVDVLGDHINSLSLSQNDLTRVPDLSSCLSVVSLDLSSNLILQPSGLPRTLQTLNLSANNLQNLHQSTFLNLTRLKTLDVSWNVLTSLGNQTFKTLTLLEFLNLSHNKLTVLNELSLGNLTNLQVLDVSWNQLTRITSGSLWQLPSLTRLLLSGNPQLGTHRDLIAEVGQKLHTIEASQIGLPQVPDTLTHSIRTLKLRGNFIRSIQCGQMDAYPLLQLLDLSGNSINSIEDDALGRQESLSVLYLSGNKLRGIPKSLPSELLELHLERNWVLKVYKDDLLGLRSLEVLLLNDNKITTIELGAFAHLRSLVTLDLSRNSIKILNPGSLAGPLALQIVRLSGIEAIGRAEDLSFPLSAPDHLVSLDLSGSAGLARQLLADSAALAASRELQELDISGADLEYIRSDLLHFLPELRVIRVKDNRLDCSDLQWLAVWMRRQNQRENHQVLCASPPQLRGTPLIDLQYVERINHDDFQKTINLTGKDSSTGKYVPGKIATITTTTTTTYKSVKDKDNKPRGLIKTDSTSVNETFKLERVAKKDTEAIKVVSQILVSSADLRLSSLIPLSNDEPQHPENGSATFAELDRTGNFL